MLSLVTDASPRQIDALMADKPSRVRQLHHAHPSSSHIEILSQTENIDELDTRIRINLQESLIQFIKDEKRWAVLPFPEQNRLLQKLTTRSKQHSLFAEKISIRCLDDKGNIITRQASLLLDTTRNHNLSSIFDQIVNQKIARAFYEQFYFGLVEHLDRLFALEQKLMVLEANHEAQMLPITYLELQDDFLPLSQKDLELIRDNGLGIMVELIPKFLRLPLNKLFYSINQVTSDFPSLALQFYLDYYFASFPKVDDAADHRRNLIRTLFSKAFYAIVRLRGLSMTHLVLPEASRDDRFNYLTRGDEDPTAVFDRETKPAKNYDYDALIRELQHLREKEKQLKQRREILGPAIKVELTVDKVLEDVFQECRDTESVDVVDEADYYSRTLWVPKRINPLTEWEWAELMDYLTEITEPFYIHCLSCKERALIRRWSDIADQEMVNANTLDVLQALGDFNTEDFKIELKLRLAGQQRDIVEQNQDIVVAGVIKHITRMLRFGSITAEMVVRDRYDAFAVDVLPYIYYHNVTNARQEQIWVESPYPFSKLMYLINRVESMTSVADLATLSLARTLLEELLQFERARIEDPISVITFSALPTPA